MAAVLVVLLVPFAATPLTSGAARPLAVTGYVEDGSPLSVINQSAPALTTVGVDGVTLTRAANAFVAPDASMVALLTRAHQRGLRGELLLSNYDNALNNFSPQIAARLLSSRANIHAVVVQLAALVARQGWNGVTVDLEMLNQHDARALVSFLLVLRRALPRATSLSVDVGAATSLSAYLASGFDLGALARVVTRVALMTYDQHGPWSGPGPIGALTWQATALRVLLTEVPPAQVDLGVAGYGYTWPAGPRLHDGVTVSDAQARAMVAHDHVRATWETRSGEWSATLSNGTVLWWSDARSYRLRVALAARDGLHGLAVWQLGSCDPLTRS